MKKKKKKIWFSTSVCEKNETAKLGSRSQLKLGPEESC